MRRMILYLDVNHPVGEMKPGGMMIIGGDAPAWKFCNVFHNCVLAGAAVIATGIGVHKSRDKNDYIVAYSTSPRFKVGDPIHADLSDPALHRRPEGDIE